MRWISRVSKPPHFRLAGLGPVLRDLVLATK